MYSFLHPTHCKTYPVQITGSFFGSSIYQLTCPDFWTFNQLKCFLLQKFRSGIQFHQFMISVQGKIPDHEQQVYHTFQTILRTSRKVKLFLTHMVSQDSLSFEEYYLKGIRNFAYELENDIEERGEGRELNTIIPVMDRRFQNMIECLATNSYITDRSYLEGRQERGNQPAENRFDIGILARLFFILTIVLSLSSQATTFQIGIIILLLTLHFIVGRRRENREANENGANINQNNDRNERDQRNAREEKKMQNLNQEANAQQKPHLINPTNQLARKTKRVLVIFAEFLYVYVLSLFPNWNIDDHYLQKYRQNIQAYETEYENGEPRNEFEERQGRDDKQLGLAQKRDLLHQRQFEHANNMEVN